MSTNCQGTLSEESLYGCWLGKSIGGTLGLVAEGRMERMNYTFYHPIPTKAPPNDDLELQLVWLDMIERGGARLTQHEFGQAWLRSIHYMWDEYGRCRWNLRRGVPVESLGAFENPFHAGMGSPIRSEIWAALFPGDPASAAYYAAMDSSLDHGLEGIAGEVFFAVMQSLMAAGHSVAEAIAAAILRIPDDSEVACAVSLMIEQHRSGVPVWKAREVLLAMHGNENFTHAPLNVALTIWALLYGAGKFEESILLAVNGGYDTDCTAATVGATLGFSLGVEQIPKRWKEPIGNGVFIGSGILEIDAPRTLEELTERTGALIGKLEVRQWEDICWVSPSAPVELASLPGTIRLSPFGGRSMVPWANGELPCEVKEAGGAEWEWPVESPQPRAITCLVRSGARLFIDEALVVDCPASLPYVPATHRQHGGSRALFSPRAGIHRVRLELAACAADQEATVMLSYGNGHLAPWTREELPHLAILPESF